MSRRPLISRREPRPTEPLPLLPSLGIDVGGTAIKWAVTDDDGLIEAGSLDTPRDDRDDILDTIADLMAGFHDRIAAAGVTFPGLIDTIRRSTVFVPNLPGDWNQAPVARILEDATDIPVALINDARAFAYGELNVGAARGETDALFLVLGTGVGGAVALNGRLLVGELDAIGEAGHMVVEPRGELCGCGGRGCLETVASATAIVSRTTRARLMSLSPLLDTFADAVGGTLTAAHVAAAARQGDPWCQDVFERAGEGIGIAAASLAAVLRVRTVILGGGLSGAFDLLAPAASRVLEERRALYGELSLRPALLGSSAGAIGAALFAAHRLTPTPHHNEGTQP